MAETGRACTVSRAAAVVAGCGQVGLPLAFALASQGAAVAAVDSDTAAVAAVRSGLLPCHEPAAELLLRQVLAAGTLSAGTDPAIISAAEHVIVAVDGDIEAALAGSAQHLRSGQLLVLRATVAPGATRSEERRGG